MEELLVRWIWELWRGARESGRRARAASSAVHGELRKEKKRRGSANESEGRWRAREGVVDDLATLDGRENGIALHDGKAQRWGLRESSERHYCELCGTGRNREKRGRETDMWGPRVRIFFYLNSNFRIVTILPPKRNLVPRFRRKVPN